MRLVIQRCKEANVTVDGEIIGRITHGLTILFGAAQGDSPEQARKLAAKVAALRIFEDQDGKINLDIRETGGQILSISQFTLLADTRKGNRPSFIQAAAPAEARQLYDIFNDSLRLAGLTVHTGRFGAHMAVQLTNDGPTTIILEN